MWRRLGSRVWFGLRRAQADAAARHEFDAHIDLLVERYVRQGMTQEEARLAAHRQFGNSLLAREEVYRMNGFGWLDALASDTRCGLRVLVKYPGLTVAAGLALAIAIAIGAAWYDLSRELFRPALPLFEGDRIVALEVTNSLTSMNEERLLHDLIGWRRDARTLQDLGAYRTIERNLILADGGPEPVRAAAITASAFRLARVPPVLGRPLLDTDEQPGASAVVVIGYHLWQERFAGRPDAVGRTLQLGTETMTVVGVMPEGFAFPINHQLWVPIQSQTIDGPLEGPPVRVFGRLATGVTVDQANAELTLLAGRAATASPQTHEHLRPRVLPFGSRSPGSLGLEFVATHVPILLVLFVACMNVATLVYARTATREAEIATRYAIGANRGRIVRQFFMEALILASTAAIVGLAAAHLALKSILAALLPMEGVGLPFWSSPGLKLSTVPYAVGLTILGAAIFGVLPAIKATRSHVSQTLRNLGAGGSTLRFGGVWTAGLIAQIALTVICLRPAIGVAWEAVRDRIVRGQFPAEKYLAVSLELDRDAFPVGAASPAFVARMTRVYSELERRVAAESGVVTVTFADELPGMAPIVRAAELEVSPGTLLSVPNIWISAVGPRFFEAFERPVLAGRDFHEGDRTPGSRTVIVNEAFARRFTSGRVPVGLRVRYTALESADLGPWFEIVGMVRDIGMTPTRRGEAPYVFHATSPGMVDRMVMGVHMSGAPAPLATSLPSIALQLDPSLRLTEIRPLDEMARRELVPQMVIAVTLTVVVCLGLFLSATAIFALTSVSVARRTREIGLRAALGARRHRLLASIFSRVALLVGSGVAAGNLVLLPLLARDPETNPQGLVHALLVTSGLMMIVAVLACVAPARRALRIEPSDALKAG